MFVKSREYWYDYIFSNEMSARKAPTAAEVAEFASPAVNESETDKLLRKSRDQPFVPLGT